MRAIRWVIGLLVCVLVSGTLSAKRPVTEVERLQREIKRQPGDMETHCALVEALLTAGDTTEAEKSLEYALKMRETPCLYMQRARIGVSKKEFLPAARYSAQAVKAGLEPAEDSMVYAIDSLSRGGVMLCLQRMSGEEKQNSAVWRGMGEIAGHRGDTARALQYYEKAFHLGDSMVMEKMTLLRSARAEVDLADSIIAEIPFLNQTTDQLELRGKINGLPIRFSIDTTATQSTISGVETLFMLKNEYITRDQIIDNILVVINRLEIGEGMVLQDIRLRYIEKQESPVILCLRDLERLGRVRIDDKKRLLVIYKNKTL